MSLLQTLKAAGQRAFSIDWNNIEGSPSSSIDSISGSKKRRTVSGQVTSLDDQIKDRDRKSIVLTSRNVTQNFELAAWAIRKHLDFTSSFSFSVKSGIPSFDLEISEFIGRASRPENFDSAGKHSLARTLRIAESMRCLDGDVFLMKLRTGRIQAIEGDRVKTPEERRDAGDFNVERTFNGVETSFSGRHLRYAVHNRSRGGGLTFDRWIPARNIFAHGFYTRFDQVRGVSPIVAALGRFQDVYEGFDYAHQLGKLSNLFGLVLTRDAAENGLGALTSSDADGDGEDDTHSVKLSNRPMVLDLDPGEDAKFLENKTPAFEFQQFSDTMIMVALKALDIPFSFYNESFTNFFGSKSALTQYLISARAKRADNSDLLRRWTIWRIGVGILDGSLTIPREFESLEDVPFKWNANGVPWLDPRDIRGDIDAVKAGLKTRSEVRHERFGDEWSDVAEKLAEEESLIDELGLSVTMDNSSAAQVVEVDNQEE